MRRQQHRDLTELMNVASSSPTLQAQQKEKFRQIDQTLFELILREAELRAMLTAKEKLTGTGEYVLNERSGCWHRLTTGTCISKCGWSFESAPHRPASGVPSASWLDMCDKSPPLRRRAAYRGTTGRLDEEPESSPEKCGHQVAVDC